MKKLLSLLTSLLLVAVFAISATCCTPIESPYSGGINIFVVDGAPALAFSKLMHEENKLGKENLTYSVIKSPSPSDLSENISTVVAKKTATAALLPINLAVKLCGNGENYKLLSVNTHGNLYGLSKQEFSALADLKGKKVGVIQLANVPGLTFKAILAENNIPFTTDDAAITADTVYLKNIEASQVGTVLNATDESKLDFVIAPEPQVSKITSSAPAIKSVFSLQELWGESSYPQAALVVKNELAKDTEFCNALLSALSESAEWVKAHGAEAHAAIASHCVEGYTTSLTAPVLTQSAITGCNIKCVKASDMKNQIVDYMLKINAVSGENSFGYPTANFFI